MTEVRSEAIGHSDANAQTIRKVMLRVLPISVLLYMFHSMDKANISFAQPGMAADLGMSLAVFGLAAGLLGVGYLIFEVPSNILLKRFGARVWLARIAVTWGLATVLTGFVQNIPQLYAARIVLGAAEAGLFPGLMLYFTFWFRPQERAKAIAVLVLAAPLALILGSITGGLILDHIHWFDLSSWRWILILQGAATVLVGIAVLFLLPATPKQARFLTSGEAQWLEGEIAKSYDNTDGNEPETLRSQLRAMKNLTVVHLGLVNFLAAVGLTGFATFAPLIIRQMNPTYSATDIGFVGAIPFLVGAIGLVIVGRSSDRSKERRFHVMAMMLLGATGLLGTIYFMHLPILGLICLSAVAVAVFGYIAPFWALSTQMLSKAHAVVGLAVINSIATIGGFLGPLVIGTSAVGNNASAGLYFPVGCFLLAALLVVLIKLPKPDPTAEVSSH